MALTFNSVKLNGLTLKPPPPPPPSGAEAYTVAGTYTWIVPTGVTSVSAVAIGGGGAGSMSDPWGG